MKLYINNGTYGWYTTAKNYKDDKDKQYVSLYFPKGSEPGEDTKAINPKEWKLTCYKGKVGMTIFSYEIMDEDNSMMGGDRANSGESIGIDSDALPFY